MIRIRTLLVLVALVAVGLFAYRQWRTPRCTHFVTYRTKTGETTVCTHPKGQCPDLMRANR
jgi:hypothetical protein